MLRRRFWLCLVSVIGACVQAGAPHLKTAPQLQPRNQACSVSTAPPRRLIVEDGNELYVEAVAHASSGSAVLLAGTPNYLWQQSTRSIARNKVFGAIITSDTISRSIASPVDPRLLSSIRASGRGDGTWDVVFGQLAPYPTNQYPPESDVVERLWHGVYDGQSWHSVKEIPVPHGLTLHGSRSSELIRRGDTLAWALRATTSNFYTDIVLFERHGEHWTSEIVPTRRAAYVSITNIDSIGLTLALVGPDTTLPRPSHDSGSLFLWTRKLSEWTMQRRVVLGIRDGAVDHPTLAAHGRDASLVWLTTIGGRTEARGLIRSLSDTTTPLVIDAEYDALKPVEVASLRGGTRYWITDHEGSSGTKEIRFLVLSASEVQLVGAVPHPFLRSFRAARISDSTLLLTGTHIDSAGQRPVSLNVRVAVRCTQGRRQG